MTSKQNAETTDIRMRVADRTLQSLSTETALKDEFLNELRGLLEETKPPKAESFVKLVDKHAGGESE